MLRTAPVSLFPTGPEGPKVFAHQPSLCQVSAEMSATVQHSPALPALPALPESLWKQGTPECWFLLVWRPLLQRAAVSLKGSSASSHAAHGSQNQLLGKLLQGHGSWYHSSHTPALAEGIRDRNTHTCAGIKSRRVTFLLASSSMSSWILKKGEKKLSRDKPGLKWKRKKCYLHITLAAQSGELQFWKDENHKVRF